MNCEKCGSKTRMQVQVIISAPGELTNQLSKRSIRRGDVHLIAAMWETANYTCTNPDCGYTKNGYGNYVTNLRKELERLNATFSRRQKKQ